MRIPKQIQLHGKTIPVRFIKGLSRLSDGGMASGIANVTKSVIKLSKHDYNGIAFGRQQLEEVFLHEVVHFIFAEAGKYDLMCNEELVDEVAALFHQVIKQIEGK